MVASNFFQGRLAIQQRVIPVYRASFFDLLASMCTGGLSVFAGQPQPDEQILAADHLDVAHLHKAYNRHYFKMGSMFYQCSQSGILEWLVDWDPDALIVEANPRYPTTPKAVDWMHEHNRLVMGWGLGAPPLHGFFSQLRSRSRRDFLLTLDGVLAYSKRGAEEYLSVGFAAENIFVASNATAHRPASPFPTRSLPIHSRPKVLFVGRLQTRKRIDLLIKACAELPEPQKPHLQIVGDGPSRVELQELAKKIYPDTKFMGARYGKELEQIFLKADLFVLPGTGGLAVQQAMSFGLPVIVARGDGTQDDLVRSQNGWQISPDNLSELTAVLHSALSDIERLREMGAESYRIVIEEINLEEMAASFIKALNKMQESKRSLL